MRFCTRCHNATQYALAPGGAGGGTNKTIQLVCPSCGHCDQLLESAADDSTAGSRVFRREVIAVAADAGDGVHLADHRYARLDPTVMRVSGSAAAASPGGGGGGGGDAAAMSHSPSIACPRCAHPSMIVVRNNNGAFDFQPAFTCPSCTGTWLHLTVAQ